jgi:serine-type D-Ala-D-Ala carboxypeptidase (penicillin-binding protein 5/6)
MRRSGTPAPRPLRTRGPLTRRRGLPAAVLTAVAVLAVLAGVHLPAVAAPGIAAAGVLTGDRAASAAARLPSTPTPGFPSTPTPDLPPAPGLPPPTPVGPSASPSPFPTVLATPPPSPRRPTLHAASAVLEDLDSGEVLYAKRDHQRRPVASLTKVMTALLVLERADLSSTAVASRLAASQPSSRLGLRAGERIRVGDLLTALLLQSANDAAVALAEHVGGSVGAFVALMNRRAAELGLPDTRFFSPNGLDDRGYSTAVDLARLTRAAYAHPEFARLVATREAEVPAPRGPPRRLQNRNVLLWLYPGAVGVKTGFTTPAGHCVIAAARRGDRGLLSVVLGLPDEPFSEGATLLDYGFTAFERVTVIHRGEAAGRVRVGDWTVAARAGADLRLLLRRSVVGRVRTELVPAPFLRPPLATGERVGAILVRAPGRPVRRVPAVAVASVPPPRPAAVPVPPGLAQIVMALARVIAGPFL